MRISKENRFAIYGVVFYGGIALNSSLRENPQDFRGNPFIKSLDSIESLESFVDSAFYKYLRFLWIASVASLPRKDGKRVDCFVSPYGLPRKDDSGNFVESASLSSLLESHFK